MLMAAAHHPLCCAALLSCTLTLNFSDYSSLNVASSVPSSHVFCAAGIAHMMGSLKAELQAAGSSVSVHTISPGMVLTGDVHPD